MGHGDVQKATKRTSSYEMPVIWKVSTAKYPEYPFSTSTVC